LIVSNPPYVADGDTQHLDVHVKQYEPAEALYGGPTGLELTVRLIAEASRVLEPGGYLLLETSPMLADSLRQEIERSGDFADCTVTKDLAGLPRTVQARKL
jgi:release factor glutamine methyltransferase